jgi:2-dehydropantoate 2-reductase
MDVVGNNRLLGSVIELSAESFEPGKIKRKTPPSKTWIGLGEINGSISPRLNIVKNILQHSAKVDFSNKIENAKWTKLVANAMILAPFAMIRASSYDSLADPLMRKLIPQIGEEAIAVGNQLGYQIEGIFGLRAEDMIGSPAQISEKLVETLIGHIGKKSQNATTQDVIKGRRTETRFINGLIVEKGELHHIFMSQRIKQFVKLCKKLTDRTLSAQLNNIEYACALAGIA